MKLRQSGTLIALVTIAVAACSDPAPEQQATHATPVRATEAITTTADERFRGAGTVASRAEMDLAFKMAGYVAEILVDEGDRVAEAQVLARLNRTEVDARVRSARAQAELTTKNLARMERLYADSVVTEARLDEARDANERARAALELAGFDQRHATIRAPAPGRILARNVEVSEFAGPGTPIFRFGSTASGWVVRVGIPDHQILRVASGATARVGFAALGPAPLQGTVSEIADAADPRSGTFEVEIAIADAGVPLRSGMVAEVELDLTGSQPLVFLPLASVVDAEGRAGSIFVIEEGTARRRDVRIVSIGVDGVGIDADGVEGAQVVTTGAAYLRDGDRVALVSS